MNGECHPRTGRTLDKHCKPDGCKLYWTKKNTTPRDHKGFYEAYLVWRARQKGGLKHLDGPYWAEKAYLLGNSVSAQVEAEINDPDNDADDGYIGMTETSDSEAFSLMRANLLEMRRNKS